MVAEPLLDYQKVLTELLSFLGAFAASGAIGFRHVQLRARVPTSQREEAALLATASARSAGLGLAGLGLGALLLALRLPAFAARRHTTVAHLVTSDAALLLQVTLLALGVIGFALAAGRRHFGWGLAALAVFALPLRGIVTGELLRLVNPLHVLAGGLWIGTLFHLLVFGIGAARSSALPAERKSALVGVLVRRFSPLALGAFALLAGLGLVTAWRHLKRLDALWSTPYGWALLAKLAFVAAVVTVGAFNWKRVAPRLDGEAGPVRLARSARIELLLAGVVLGITALLVSLPTPGE